jgi:2-polyprenyl-3-methyl-5-hydroxy-6-metoxy-1,4-benzoquinol methylase
MTLKKMTNCPVCESSHLSFAFSAPTTRGLDQRQWSVFECSSCGHQFMNPQPSWQELQVYYNNEYIAYQPAHGSEDSNDEREVAKAKRNGFIRHIPVPAGLRVLDVGCGGGWFLRICKELGAIVQGVEPSEYATEMARKQGLQVFCGTLEEYIGQAPDDTQFDIITANHVVEHLPDPVKTLRSMKRVLAPGGYVWIAVPNAAYPICRALKGRWHSSDLPYHLMHFTPASMAVAGHRAGFKVRHQMTESIPTHVTDSIGLFLRYRCFLPRRLTQHFGFITTVSKWYAQRVDAKVIGEALLTEFTATDSIPHGDQSLK